MRKTALMLLSTITLTGCHNMPVWQYEMLEHPPGNKAYPAIYLKGWKDGCHTGTAASANHFYRFRYSFVQDWQLAQDETYHKGWKDAFTHCRKYVLQHNLRSMGKKTS